MPKLLFFAQTSFPSNMLLISVIGGIAFLLLLAAMVAKWYKKVPQGKTLVRTGMGGTKVSFEGMIVLPVLHKLEIMDISLKSVEINRTGKDGLICKDNMRADIKVVFFVRVNKTKEDVVKVAQTIGTGRASHEETLVSLFDAKFSEALKTVGKQFDFVQLYDSRSEFKERIIDSIGTDLNGYELDDAAIDYLEQTPLALLKDDNILDSEGIKKITELTAKQHILANRIRREEEQEIKRQDVEAREAILELERRQAEKEEIQQKEIETIKAREQAETAKVQHEERLKSEQARILAEEELAIMEENKLRQVIVAAKNKERTDLVESQRVLKDELLEQTEKERIVELAMIEKQKAVEEEKKNIQDVIRERVMVEKAVVTEEERIKDTRAFAEADRTKQVAITAAEMTAEEALIKEVQTAEAGKQAAVILAEQKLIEAEAEREASQKESEAKKVMAEAIAAEEAALGVAQAQVMEAKALAKQKEGKAEAVVIQMTAEAKEKEGLLQANVVERQAKADALSIEAKALAEAKGIEAKAAAEKEQGTAEAEVIRLKLEADATGIEAKAEAMKKLDGVGKDHEEFKLRLQRDTEIELAKINIQRDIAEAQAQVISEALKSAKIDIVGGETTFFDSIIGAVTNGKKIDRMISNSDTLSEVKQNLLGDGTNGGNMLENIRDLVKSLGITSEDIKNLSIANVLTKAGNGTEDGGVKGLLSQLLTAAKQAGLANQPASLLGV